ncbi:hypothetical protein SRABI76_01208 [Microbacterium oxydans]|uniref:hypothetical protein n=1 Tax=Microbacterium oxydans TaxID=82380 RepID=UPI001D8EF888|nr:hypothetical protein [Microbacterium oxydans]CAH0168115.1 hypothetical protein SRABI76_01208 [Microbacterium oxydans]
MDRILVVAGQIAIAPGHRIEVTEQADPLTNEPVLLSLTDLDTGIRYRTDDVSGELSRWLGRVLDCTVTIGTHSARTTLTVDPIGPGSTGAKVALREADAAADAAKAEADRWGGSDRQPAEETERFW